jgi:hypothetical protein
MEHQSSSGSCGVKALLLANLWVMVAACDVAAEAEPAASVEAQSAANVVVEREAEREAEAKAAGPAGAGAEVEAGAEAEVAVVIAPASFDLEAVASVVHEGEVESAAELEVLVNDEARGYNRIDIDADGKIDHIQVVEVKGPSVEIEADAEVEAEANVAADAVLELRAVPSSSASVEAAVTFATVSFVRRSASSEVEIRAGYTAVVHQPKVRVYTRVVPVKLEAGVLVGGSLFLTWLYAVDRPVYVGVYEVDARGRWIPPGHVKHGHWKATGDASARGRVEVHDKGSKKAFGGDDGRVKVDVRGGTKGSGKASFGGSAKGGGKVQVGGSASGSGKAKASASTGTGKGGKSGSGKGGKGK